MKSVFSLLVFLTLYLSSSAQLYQEYLLSDWTFKSTTSKYWLPALVPGNSVDDLLLNGKESVKVSDTTWQYQTSFIVDEQTLSRDFIELLFEGLDTRATVYLNQEKILEANNMFRSWAVPVKSLLNDGENKLLIEFETDAYNLSLRKAFYHYDSELSIIPVGVWRPVILESWNEFRLDDVSYAVSEIADKSAHLMASINFRVDKETPLDVEIFNEVTGKTYARKQVLASQENSQIDIPFTIRKPKLWWPASLGKANLYKIGVRAKNADNEQTVNKRIGIRTVEIDSASNREGLRLIINGKSIAIKKSDYRPSVLNISGQSTAEYEDVFAALDWLENNMIHVLSDGVYENEYFYDLADVNGVMIFQDFMFPPAVYPQNDQFLENVRKEAVENVESLQHHPSIVVWGGISGSQEELEDSSVQVNRVLKKALKNENSSYLLITD